MTPVYLKPGVGNCMSACIASLLDLRLDQVVDLGIPAIPNYWAVLDSWLAARALAFVHVAVPQRAPLSVRGDHYYVATGPPASNRNGAPHAVIYQYDRQVHDPAPATGGLWRVEEISFLVPLSLPMHVIPRTGPENRDEQAAPRPVEETRLIEFARNDAGAITGATMRVRQS